MDEAEKIVKTFIKKVEAMPHEPRVLTRIINDVLEHFEHYGPLTTAESLERVLVTSLDVFGIKVYGPGESPPKRRQKPTPESDLAFCFRKIDTGIRDRDELFPKTSPQWRTVRSACRVAAASTRFDGATIRKVMAESNDRVNYLLDFAKANCTQAQLSFAVSRVEFGLAELAKRRRPKKKATQTACPGPETPS